MKKNFFLSLFLMMLLQQITSAQSWSITGNSGTNPPTNFLGTTNNKALVFKTNNSERMRIAGTGKVGIGVTSPAYKLDIAGDINIGSGNFFRINGTPVFKDNLSTLNLLIGENTSSSSNGTSNTAVGINSLGAISTGHYNTALGYAALYATNSGLANTALGFQSMLSNTSGTDNTAVGENTLLVNTMGDDNVAIGSAALSSLTTANDNTSVGFGSLPGLTTGESNTAVGVFADVNDGTYSNSIAIGISSLITASSQARIGSSFITSIGGYVDWTNISDGRFKRNIQSNIPGLEFINKLKPVSYTLAIHDLDDFLRKGMKNSVSQSAEQTANEEKAIRDKETIVYSGFIAQDVATAAKEVGYDFSGVDVPKNDKDVYGLRYAEFVVPLVKAVQELDDNQKSEVGSRESEVAELKQEIEDLKSRIGSLQSSIESGQSPMSNGFAKLQTSDFKPQTILGQNIPNPFGNSTLIPFRIPKDCHDASIMITNTSTSEVISVIPLSCNEDHVSIDPGTLTSGTYSYTLYVDGKVIDTKQMVIQK